MSGYLYFPNNNLKGTKDHIKLQYLFLINGKFSQKTETYS